MKRLLVIRFGALGDLIHLSPSLDAVKKAHPELEIHLLTSPIYQNLASLFPAVKQVWTWDKKTGWAGLWKLASSLRQIQIDAVVNLHPSLKSWLLTQALQPVQQATYHKQKLAAKGKAQRHQARLHAVTDFYQPFRRLLNLPEQEFLTSNLSLPEQITHTLPTKPEHERWIGIIPGVGAKRSNRAWEPERYIELITALSKIPGLRILLIGGPDEQPLAQQILNTFTHATDTDVLQNHCGLHDIPTTAAWLAQCDWVVGGDTGPLHLAAAVGVPILSIYGPTAVSRTGPRGCGPTLALTPPEELFCWPCELPQCPYTGKDHLACMKQIPVASVLKAMNLPASAMKQPHLTLED